MNYDKEEAKKLLDKLPEDASWNDIIYSLHVKMKLSESLKAAKEGRVVSHDDAKKRFSHR